MTQTNEARGMFDPGDPAMRQFASSYEEQMVPIVFGPWAEDLVDRLDLNPAIGGEASAGDDANRTRFVSGIIEHLDRYARGATHELPWVATVAVATKPV